MSVKNIPVGGKGRWEKKRYDGSRAAAAGESGRSQIYRPDRIQAREKNLNLLDTDKEGGKMNKNKNGSGNVDAS